MAGKRFHMGWFMNFTTNESNTPEDALTPRSRSFLPLMAASGVTMTFTAPLEVRFIREHRRNWCESVVSDRR